VCTWINNYTLISYKEINGIHQQRRKKDRLRSLSPRSREAGSNTYTTIMQDITKMGTYTKKKIVAYDTYARREFLVILKL
jgi:hypothetical protein